MDTSDFDPTLTIRDAIATGAVDRLSRLAEFVWHDLPMMTPAEKTERAIEERRASSDLDGMLADFAAMRLDQADCLAKAHAAAREAMWFAEIIEDPTTLELVEAFLLTTDEGRAIDDTREAWRRWYPLSIESPALPWHCMNCGTPHDAGDEAVVVGDQSESGLTAELDPRPAFCASCIGILASALGVGASIDTESLR